MRPELTEIAAGRILAPRHATTLAHVLLMPPAPASAVRLQKALRGLVRAQAVPSPMLPILCIWVLECQHVVWVIDDCPILSGRGQKGIRLRRLRHDMWEMGEWGMGYRTPPFVPEAAPPG